jgi:hypothetical protein
MTPLNCFILVLRGFGVWQAIDVIEDAAVAYALHAGTYRPRELSFEFYLLSTGVHFLLAVLLLYFAPAMARLFYPSDRQP